MTEHEKSPPQDPSPRHDSEPNTSIRPDSVAGRVETEAFSRSEVLAVYRNPLRVVDVLLSDWQRLAVNIGMRTNLGLLVLLMFLVSVAASMPFGAILDAHRSWRIAALFVGSLAICFPSLWIFSAYLGCNFRIEQSLGLALVISSIAALFSFGFFPILWFLDTTMLSAQSELGTEEIAIFLIAVSLLAGFCHLGRCMSKSRSLGPQNSYSILMFFWLLLLLFITYRMALALELL